MLVRMWTLRGLDKLYEAGFPGLMAALDEFQKQWLDGNKAVSARLVSFSSPKARMFIDEIRTISMLNLLHTVLDGI